MKRLSRKSEPSYTFDYSKKVVLTVEEFEDFIVETEDNLSGFIKTEKDLPILDNMKPYTDFEPRKFNPVNGPIFINGAEKGDLIILRIKKIIPSETGYTYIRSDFGPLSESSKWPELRENYTKILKHIPGPSGTTSDGKAIYNNKISWNLTPFIGTIGVCPDFEIHSSLVGQFPCGGNWDCRDIKEGSKLILNCYHKGALLYLGDVHGSQGDTEWSGVANEVKAEVNLSCEIIKNKKIPYGRIEKEESIIQLFSDKPLEDAVHQAIVNLMDWMIEDFSIKPRDAYILISTVPDFRINIYQMIRNPLFKYVVGAEFPKKYL
ncbi:MAG: acetamidase/formamidase family protein [Candidatus Humimicrobiaceae bacterium]